MRTVTEYNFTANADMTYDFTIQVELVGGVYFDMQLAAGWNMVSFPCIPVDPSFANIFSAIGYYQVLTWDGTSYITPTMAEAGKGYWVLVLANTTVTITNGIPVEMYERDLSPGWSMIGSIINCTVDADLVFPAFYQLLTWDGSSYVSTTTIEPGKGYWAVVLDPTHIVVDESCSISSESVHTNPSSSDLVITTSDSQKIQMPILARDTQ